MKNREAFAETNRAIANHLGWEWAFDEEWFADNNVARLNGPDDAHIHLRPSTYEYTPDDGTRLEISGSYPHHPGYGSFAPRNDCPRITVSAAKPPHKIANDLRKRFLPHYMPLYADALEGVARYEQSERLQESAAQQLAQIMGSEVGTNGRVYRPSHFEGYGHIEVQHGGDKVNFKLSSIPLDLALQIAMILGEAQS